jgi:pimeloyl-ACP methyl ester carboxylesterase
MWYSQICDAVAPQIRTRIEEENIMSSASGLPGLAGRVELDNVGHWVQHEASAEVSKQLVQFLRTLKPA